MTIPEPNICSLKQFSLCIILFFSIGIYDLNFISINDIEIAP